MPLCGRAAKPGRTDPGREPCISPRCPGGRAPPCVGGRCPGAKRCSPGRIGLAGGRGIDAPEEKGLLPARGGRGIDVGDVGEVGAAEVGATGVTGTTGTAGLIFGCSATSFLAASCNSSGKSSTDNGLAASFLAAAFLAGAFFALGASWLGVNSGNLSINLRSTGASTVDDADRTNSPTSCNLASSSLLSSPNSFANS